jgi:hypothetical protein
MEMKLKERAMSWFFVHELMVIPNAQQDMIMKKLAA